MPERVFFRTTTGGGYKEKEKESGQERRKGERFQLFYVLLNSTAKGDVLTYRQTNKRITRDQEKGGRGREAGRKGGDVFHCGTGTSTAADNTKGYACVANLVDSAQTRGSLFLQPIVPKRIGKQK